MLTFRLQPGPFKILGKQLLNGLTIILGIAIVVSAVTAQWIEVGAARFPKKAISDFCSRNRVLSALASIHMLSIFCQI